MKPATLTLTNPDGLLLTIHVERFHSAKRDDESGATALYVWGDPENWLADDEPPFDGLQPHLMSLVTELPDAIERAVALALGR